MLEDKLSSFDIHTLNELRDIFVKKRFKTRNKIEELTVEIESYEIIVASIIKELDLRWEKEHPHDPNEEDQYPDDD